MFLQLERWKLEIRSCWKCHVPTAIRVKTGKSSTANTNHAAALASTQFVASQAVYEGEGWVGLGFSSDGVMVGADAVIGLPDEDTALEYDLGGYVSHDLGVLACAKFWTGTGS